MSFGAGFLTCVCVLIALIGGTIQPLGASAEMTGSGSGRPEVVHSLAPDARCLDAVIEAGAHNGPCIHVCSSGAALMWGQIELTTPRAAAVRPKHDADAGGWLCRPDPQPPKTFSDKL